MSEDKPSQNAYEISTDRNRLDIGMIHEFLRTSYWAKNIPLSVVERSLQHSLCFGAYHAGKLVGFARVVSDFATFAYLADVFVIDRHRGKGVAQTIVKAAIDHPDLQGLRRFMLATRDAHWLYAKLGFQLLDHPERFMSRTQLNVYEEKAVCDTPAHP